MMLRVIQYFMWPFHRFGDALELRRLHRKLPSAHRRLISTPEGTRMETDTEYLVRLRQIYLERFGD
jgi:hypothetical protein